MDRTEFENGLRRDGYDAALDRHMDANATNPEHSHEFDARLLIIEGEITIGQGGVDRTYRTGDSCAFPAGTKHTEHAGPQGVRYLAGRRFPQKQAG